MHANDHYRLIKYSTVFGCCLIMSPCGTVMYWGNLAAYCVSYFMSILDSPTGVESSWVYSFLSISWTCTFLFSGTIVKRIGRKCTLLVGIFFNSLAIFLSYFSVQISMASLTFTMGVLSGLGTGLSDGTTIPIVLEWGDTNEIGRLTSILHGSISIGALIVNQVITWYINPENLVPTYRMGPTTYFVQRKVLDRVPSVFLVIGIIIMIMQLTGIAMITEKKKFDIIHSENIPIKEAFSKERKDKATNNDYMDNSKGSSTDNDLSTIPNEENKRTDLTYKEMLQCKSFYTQWITYFVVSMPLLIVSSYYKIFGQIWIHDDHFMGYLATTMSLGGLIACPLSGLAFDTFGVKRCQLTLTLMEVTILVWYYFTPMINRWLFFFASFIFMNVTVALYNVFVSSTALLYGTTHMATNFGLMMTAMMAYHIISPFMVGRLLTNLGWFFTFVTSSVAVLLCVIPMILFLPDI